MAYRNRVNAGCAVEEWRKRAYLKQVTSCGTPIIVRLTETMVFGRRHLDCLSGFRRMSVNHAEFRRVGRKWFLRNLNSKNGLCKNFTPLEEEGVRLTHGNLINFGKILPANFSCVFLRGDPPAENDEPMEKDEPEVVDLLSDEDEDPPVPGCSTQVMICSQSGEVPDGRHPEVAASGQVPDGRQPEVAAFGQVPDGRQPEVAVSGQVPDGSYPEVAASGQVPDGRQPGRDEQAYSDARIQLTPDNSTGHQTMDALAYKDPDYDMELIQVNGQVVPHHVITMPKDSSGMFKCISWFYYKTRDLDLAVREEVVKYVVENYKEFWVYTSGKNGLPFDTPESYGMFMLKPSTYGTVLELKAAASVFNMSFEVYCDGRLHYYFGNENSEVKRIRFTGQLFRSGYYDVYLPCKRD